MGIAFYKVYFEEYNRITYYKDVVDYIHSLKGRCLIGILSNLLMLRYFKYYI